MKIANIGGRAVLIQGDAMVDIATASDGKFGPDPMSIYADWDAFVSWARSSTGDLQPYETSRLGTPVPMPKQILAIGINYREHASEAQMQIPDVPVTFTKFASSLSGPYDAIPLVGDTVDWEVELVAVIGRECFQVDESEAWDVVAGLTVGQDISDRALQFAAGNQFSLGKSRPGYGPIGPWVVTVDEFSSPDDLALGCSIDGEKVQDGRTRELVFSVPRLIAELTAILPLFPGDLIFTGTPSGVGAARTPPRFLRAGQVLESWVEGIGTLRNTCV